MSSPGEFRRSRHIRGCGIWAAVEHRRIEGVGGFSGKNGGDPFGRYAARVVGRGGGECHSWRLWCGGEGAAERGLGAGGAGTGGLQAYAARGVAGAGLRARSCGFRGPRLLGRRRAPGACLIRAAFFELELSLVPGLGPSRVTLSEAANDKHHPSSYSRRPLRPSATAPALQSEGTSTRAPVNRLASGVTTSTVGTTMM